MRGKRNHQKRIEKLLKEMQRERGYVSVPKSYVARKDPDFMEAYNKLYNIGLRAGKALPVKVREFVAIAILAYRGREVGVYEHMKRAIRHGATKQELMEAIETTIIPGGGPAFDTGIRALMRIEEEGQKRNKNAQRPSGSGKSYKLTKEKQGGT
ncbi:MAG: carboxymuconolactone decarboxylase family protein [Deltaproteobacteria bacterium]|nr:carboxymuconolactone decarboxylase family protein [Deltaproteobacteria bacterium]